MTESAPPCRLYVLVATAAPVALIWRRGPASWWHLLEWDLRLPEGFGPAALVMPGVLALQGPAWDARGEAVAAELGAALEGGPLHGTSTRWPLVVLCDDASMVARTLANFLWVTFTRSNPSHDVHGVGAFVEHKHWGCRGAVIVDARAKPHHAPALEEDPEVTRRVEALAAPGGPLHGLY